MNASKEEVFVVDSPRERQFWFEDATNSGRADYLASPSFDVRTDEIGSIVLSPSALLDAYRVAFRHTPIELPTELVESNSQTTNHDVSTAKAVRKAHEDSGLTWELLARVFAVSRRSVHSWANGARMNATNVELLMRFNDFLDKLPGETPSDRRAQILSIGSDGRSLLDRFRTEYSRVRDAFVTTPRPESLLEARHDSGGE